MTVPTGGMINGCATSSGQVICSLANPNFASAHYNKAICYAMQGDSELIKQSLQKALELNPRYRREAKADPNFAELAREDWFKDLIEAT